jgi:hypothetical protein
MDIEKNLGQINPYNTGLNKRIAYYLHSMEQEDYDGILLLTYPGIFELVPQNLLREKIIETFRDEEMKISMDVFDINKIGNLIEANEGSYVRVDYTLLMSLRLKVEPEEPEEKRQERKSSFLRNFQIAYGHQNTWFEENTQSYCFHKRNSMVAIRDHQSPEWTFLTLQPGSPILEKFLPLPVRLLLETGIE